MSYSFPVKVRYRDLKEMGVVRDRVDLHEQIKRGILRPPHKNGPTMQALAWWWGDDIAADLERERKAQEEAAK